MIFAGFTVSQQSAAAKDWVSQHISRAAAPPPSSHLEWSHPKKSKRFHQKSSINLACSSDRSIGLFPFVFARKLVWETSSAEASILFTWSNHPSWDHSIRRSSGSMLKNFNFLPLIGNASSRYLNIFTCFRDVLNHLRWALISGRMQRANLSPFKMHVLVSSLHTAPGFLKRWRTLFFIRTILKEHEAHFLLKI